MLRASVMEHPDSWDKNEILVRDEILVREEAEHLY
jgi:hypothetical protein